MRRLLCLWVAVLSCALATNLNAQTDDCASATAVGEGTFAFDNTGSTLDGPDDCDANMSGDFWVLYTATVTGDVDIHTCNTGTLDDTTLCVYDGLAGCPIPGDLGLANDDDSCGPAGFNSQVTVTVTAGDVLLVQAGGWNGSEGTSNITIQLAGGELDCFDGIDNDLDGLLDCDDSDCAGVAGCFEADCTDGIDDDGDGDVDCADSDCAGVAICQEAGNCGDGVDNDLDGDVDCADADCAGDALCLPPILNDECVDAIAVGLGDTVFNNTGATSNGPIDCDGNMTTDVWYEFTATSDDLITINTCGSLGLTDTTLIVYDGALGCPVAPDPGLACDDDSCGASGFLSEVQLAVTTGDVLLIQAGGWNGSEGEGTLTISIVEDCFDGIDNDVDGLTDCDDDDCTDQCVEICDDGIDNDADTLIDCADPECTGDINCIENVCNDGLDDDGDGLVDCDDPDCAADTNCIEDGVECSDGLDNDSDGLTDCDDPDCFTDPACVAANDDCVNAIVVGLGDTLFDNTGTNTGVNDCDANMTTDVWFEYTAAADGNLSISTCNSLGLTDTTLIVYDGSAGCPVAPDPGLACDDDSCGGSGFLSEVQLAVVTGDVLLIQAGGWNGSEGEGTLTISIIEDCFNGIDDDGDGLPDCDDPDCTDQCVEICDDGIDNDADTLIDCDDPECAAALNCTEQTCDDGLDEDGDGLIDCADPDCAIAANCMEAGQCGDGVDNDFDGLVDCDDPDCNGDPLCAPANDLCANAIPVNEGVFAFDNTSAGLDGPTDCDLNMTTDVWYEYTATVDGPVHIDTCQTVGTLDDTTIIVYDGTAGCPIAPSAGLACDDDSCGPVGFNSDVLVNVTAGDVLLVQVGGWNGSTGDGTLSIALGETDCADGIDNDGDGDVDCLDVDCAGSTDCIEDGAECEDGLDNDGDGLIDCADADCVGTDACIENGAECADGLDNDGDGLIDCADDDCLGDCACSSIVYGGESDVIVNYDGIDGDVGLTDSAAALEAALLANGYTVLVANTSIFEAGCTIEEAAVERVWVLTGVFPSDNRPGEVADALAELTLLADAQAAGKGVYFEGSDQWGFLHVDSPFDDVDGVENDQDGADDSPDGGDLVTALDGADMLAANQDVPYTQNQAGSDWTDEFVLSTADAGLDSAVELWGPDDALGIVGQLGGDFAVTVHGVATAGGNTISSSVLFGGIGDATLQESVADTYAMKLKSAPSGGFRRADSNNDGSVNIADAVYSANALFVPGSPAPMCLDAGDANDDGLFNIADVIFTANFLFIMGSPAPPAPFPGCGTDGTADALDCPGFLGTGC